MRIDRLDEQEEQEAEKFAQQETHTHTRSTEQLQQQQQRRRTIFQSCFSNMQPKSLVIRLASFHRKSLSGEKKNVSAYGKNGCEWFLLLFV